MLVRILLVLSGALTLFVLAGNTLLRPLVNAIDRIPLSETSSEATYTVTLTTTSARAAELRDTLIEKLESANYPVRETRVIFRSNETVEIAASLVSMAAEPGELDAVVTQLSGIAGVEHASWSVSALD